MNQELTERWKDGFYQTDVEKNREYLRAEPGLANIPVN